MDSKFINLLDEKSVTYVTCVKSGKIYTKTSIITWIDGKIFFSCLHATVLWHFTVKLQIIIQLMVGPSSAHSNHLKQIGLETLELVCLESRESITHYVAIVQ